MLGSPSHKRKSQPFVEIPYMKRRKRIFTAMSSANHHSDNYVYNFL